LGVLFQTRKKLQRPSGIVLMAAVFAVLLATSTAAVLAQETISVECVKRTPAAAAPPRPLVPLRSIAGSKERIKEKDADKPAKLVCADDEVPTLGNVRPESTAPPPGLMKGNPLLRPQSTVQPQSEGLSAKYFRFEDVYQKKRSSRSAAKPPPAPPAACSGACYYYASSGARRSADGAGMAITVHRPGYTNNAGAGHTLVELSVQGGPSDGHIAEVGWIVSTDMHHDADPHIFVFHWINWNGTCYNGCGWQQVSNKYYPGQNISSLIGKEVYIGYVFYNGNWWAWFDDQWIGYFPGSLWQNSFTKSTLMQWFGEVATTNGAPKNIQMGDGLLPPPPTAARITTLCDVDAKSWICAIRDQQVLAPPTAPAFYDIARVGFGSARYGGPGQ